MLSDIPRREVLKSLLAASAGVAMSPRIDLTAQTKPDDRRWRLCVQQYSFNRQLRSGKLDIHDYPRTVVEGTGIKVLEWFNGHIEEKANDTALFKDLRKRCDDLEAETTIMLCRGKKALDSPDASVRREAVLQYDPWLEAVQILGGTGIRVDVRSPGDPAEQLNYATEGLQALCERAAKMQMNILVENHGGHSSNGKWVASLMKRVDRKNCGTLPDFQNFQEYDKYLGVQEMMPFAKVVCAKSKEFDDEGNEEFVDYFRMLKIVKDSGFRGDIGIEYEGEHDPVRGINLTKALIERVMDRLDAA